MLPPVLSPKLIGCPDRGARLNSHIEWPRRTSCSSRSASAPGLCFVAPNDLRIDRDEAVADIRCTAKATLRRPIFGIAALLAIEENAADPARLFAMLQPEIFVAAIHGTRFCVRDLWGDLERRRILLARRALESDDRDRPLRSAPVQHRRKIRSAAEPCFVWLCARAERSMSEWSGRAGSTDIEFVRSQQRPVFRPVKRGSLDAPPLDAATLGRGEWAVNGRRPKCDAHLARIGLLPRSIAFDPAATRRSVRVGARPGVLGHLIVPAGAPGRIQRIRPQAFPDSRRHTLAAGAALPDNPG